MDRVIDRFIDGFIYVFIDGFIVKIRFVQIVGIDSLIDNRWFN
jgi:hypothetical protein